MGGGGPIGGGGGLVMEFPDVPTPLFPRTLTSTRLERKFRYMGRDRRIHTITMRDLYTVDDAVINMGKAFLFGLITRQGYGRPDSAQKLKRQLSRTSLVF